jgi:LacI family transcriptional regulator
VIPYLEGRFFPSVVHGIEMAASRAGYSAIICQSNEDVGQERRHLNVLVGAQVAGVLVSLSRGTYDYQHLTSLSSRGLPLVCFDRVAEGCGVNAVVLDDFAAGYASTQHLINQGCRRIAHLAGPQHLNTYKNRFLGYLQALQEANLLLDSSLIVNTEMRHSYAVAATRQLLANPDRPDGLFAAGDNAALGAMQEVLHQGLRVPADIAIAGFSNEAFTSSTVPAITTVDQGGEEMGRAAVKLLLELIRAGRADFKPRRVVLAPKLLVRGSSAKRDESLPGLLQQPFSEPCSGAY